MHDPPPKKEAYKIKGKMEKLEGQQKRKRKALVTVLEKSVIMQIVLCAVGCREKKSGNMETWIMQKGKGITGRCIKTYKSLAPFKRRYFTKRYKARVCSRHTRGGNDDSVWGKEREQQQQAVRLLNRG